MGTVLDKYYAEKAARLARGESKVMSSVVAVKDAFEEKVAELVAATEAAVVEAPKVMPQNSPPVTHWSSVDVKKVDG